MVESNIYGRNRFHRKGTRIFLENMTIRETNAERMSIEEMERFINLWIRKGITEIEMYRDLMDILGVHAEFPEEL